MSEQLSRYEFAQLLVDIATSTYNTQIVLDRDVEFEPKPLYELLEADEIATYDVSTEDIILFNEDTDYNTIDISFTVNGKSKYYITKNGSWPFGDTNE